VRVTATAREKDPIARTIPTRRTRSAQPTPATLTAMASTARTCPARASSRGASVATVTAVRRGSPAFSSEVQARPAPGSPLHPRREIPPGHTPTTCARRVLRQSAERQPDDQASLDVVRAGPAEVHPQAARRGERGPSIHTLSLRSSEDVGAAGLDSVSGRRS
jgi:hypothetical protein